MAVVDPAAPTVVVRDLRIELASSGADIIDEIGLELAPGEVLGLVGESGSGKTTLGMALLGYTRPGGRVTGGEVTIAGQELRGLGERGLRRLRGRTVSYVPQDPGTALNPALRISRQLEEMLEAHVADMDGARRRERMREALREVALPDDDEFLRRYPHQLSGGQQQRVAIAMAFATRPAVIVCDEPTTGLDVTTQARVLETVRELCQVHGVAALYVSHDLAVIATLADRVAVMYAGRIVERGPAPTIFSAPRHPYTRRLLRAVPDLEGRRAVVGVPGRAPLPGGRPAGCFFHPRCELAVDRCRETAPAPLAFQDGTHLVSCHRAEEAPSRISVADEPAPSGAAGEAVLTVSGLDAGYGSSLILHGVEFTVHRNACVALVGESGSGKTTTARCVAGLHRQYTGQIALDGVELAHAARRRGADARRRIQYVFQNPYSSLNPRRTVGQTLARQLRLFPPPEGVSRGTIGAAVAGCLEQVALSREAADRYPDQLSGGERQRVAIARALAARPSLLVCDEITSALDVSVQAAIVDLLRELREQSGLSLLFITHNLALIRTIADTVIVMTEGRIIESGPTVRVFERPEADYTRRLLADTPTVAVDTGAGTGPRTAAP